MSQLCSPNYLRPHLLTRYLIYLWLDITIRTIPFLNNTKGSLALLYLKKYIRMFFHSPPLKAPGPDRNHAIFFQRNWHILAPGIIHAIQEIFEIVTIPKDSGATNLVLIPKINHLYMITQFSPN